MLGMLRPKSDELTVNCSRVNFGRHGLSWAQSNLLDDRPLHVDILTIDVSGIRSIFPISIRLRSGIARAGIPATQLVFSDHLRDTIRHLVFLALATRWSWPTTSTKLETMKSRRGKLRDLPSSATRPPCWLSCSIPEPLTGLATRLAQSNL